MCLKIYKIRKIFLRFFWFPAKTRKKIWKMTLDNNGFVLIKKDSKKTRKELEIQTRKMKSASDKSHLPAEIGDNATYRFLFLIKLKEKWS